MLNKTQIPDNREVISVDITDEEFLVLAKAAHAEDLTFNHYVEKLLWEVVNKFELERKA